jgi:hypothetical protein
MTALCLGAAVIAVAPVFTLSWTHSVERVTWRETWAVEAGALRLTGAAVRGSGAGMEPGPGAVLQEGWWVWPAALSVPELVLAASGQTGAGWTLCAAGRCHALGSTPGAPLRLAPCAGVEGGSEAPRAMAD